MESTFNPAARLSESQGETSNAPKLSIIRRIDIKDSNHETAFVMYDKDKQINVPVEGPIIGILIGVSMQLTSYSDNLGKNGGQYRSDYYFTKDKITLYAPSPRGSDKVCTGTLEQIEKFLLDNSTTRQAKKKQVLFILTKDGLITVATNLIIAIDQIGTVRESLKTNYIVLHPELFKEENQTVSKKAKDFLGKFRNTNPPKYAAITVGSAITEDFWIETSADTIIEDFKRWKKYKKETKADAQDEAVGEIDTATAPAKPQAPPVPLQQQPVNDDLPF